jgi:hypothetical protein
MFAQKACLVGTNKCSISGLKENPIFSAARDPSAHMHQLEAAKAPIPFVSSADIRLLPPMSEITPQSLPLLPTAERDAILGNIGSAVH